MFEDEIEEYRIEIENRISDREANRNLISASDSKNQIGYYLNKKFGE